MTHNEISEVINHVEELWPGRIKTAHREACFQSWLRLPCCADGARVALNALAVEFKGYVTVAHITDRVKSCCYGGVASEDKRSLRQTEHEALRQADSEHLIEVERDDADTVRWMAGLDQQDIDTIVEYVVMTCGPAGRALLELGNKASMPKRVAEERRNVRALLHAAERRMATA